MLAPRLERWGGGGNSPRISVKLSSVYISWVRNYLSFAPFSLFPRAPGFSPIVYGWFRLLILKSLAITGIPPTSQNPLHGAENSGFTLGIELSDTDIR